jgi:hypothetical protein
MMHFISMLLEKEEKHELTLSGHAFVVNLDVEMVLARDIVPFNVPIVPGDGIKYFRSENTGVLLATHREIAFRVDD